MSKKELISNKKVFEEKNLPAHPKSRLNLYIIVGDTNTGKTTVLRHLMAFARSHSITSNSINVRTIKTTHGNNIDVGIQSDSALQEQNVFYTRFESYINGLNKKPANVIITLREKGGKKGKKKTGWDAIDYINYFSQKNWNIIAVAALDSSGRKNYGHSNPVWKSIQTINNGVYIPTNKVASDVRKHFGWV